MFDARINEPDTYTQPTFWHNREALEWSSHFARGVDTLSFHYVMDCNLSDHGNDGQLFEIK